MEIIEFDLKWVHMARYELILRQDGAMWLRIIFKPLTTPQRVIGHRRHFGGIWLFGIIIGAFFRLVKHTGFEKSSQVVY